MAKRRLTNEFVSLITKLDRNAGSYRISILNMKTGTTTDVQDDLDEYETWFDFFRRITREMLCLGMPEELSITAVTKA